MINQLSYHMFSGMSKTSHCFKLVTYHVTHSEWQNALKRKEEAISFKLRWWLLIASKNHEKVVKQKEHCYIHLGYNVQILPSDNIN